MRLVRCGLLMAALLVAAARVRAETVEVTAPKGSLRSSPDASGEIISLVERGARLEVLASEGRWYRVRVEGQTTEGYIHSALVGRDRAGGRLRPQKTPVSAAREESEPPVRRSRPGPAEGGRALGVGFTTGGWSHVGFGASIRSWSFGAFGVQATASHYGYNYVNSDYSAWQFSPSLIVPIHVGDRDSYNEISWKPYVGGGLTIYRSSYDSAFSSYSDTRFGVNALGGVEVSFRSIPQLTGSLQAGLFTGGGDIGLSSFTSAVLAHWYFH